MDKIISNIIRDVQVNLTDEFDRNFERKAFFDKQWSATKFHNNKGSLMMRSGNLRNSIQSKVQGTDISWSSSLPYASIHNNGGTIKVTAKMKKYFWAMFYKSSGAVTGVTQRDTRMSREAQQWKALALKKVGALITIEQRQFIGLKHPKVKESIIEAMENSLYELDKNVISKLKK